MILKGTREEMEQKAVEIISSSIKEILTKKDHVVFGIPGGRSVSGIFQKLLDADIDWNKVHIFMVDERLVAIEDKESNYKLAHFSFIGKLITQGKITASHLHPFIYQPSEKDLGIKEYEKELSSLGGTYDLLLLSSGEDCHIGALYPDHSVHDESPFFLTMEDSPKPPPKRMTISRKLLLKSRCAILLFFGEGKREAFEMFGSTDDHVRCPAKLIEKIPRNYVLTDIDARV